LALDAGIEIQGHRGTRGSDLRARSGLRAALDLGTPTLEFDLSLIADGGAVVWHDARLEAPKCAGPRRRRHRPGDRETGRLKKWRCDGLLSARFPEQRREVGPVSREFAAARHVNAFSPVTLRELLDFLELYGRKHPNAAPPKLNIETKPLRGGRRRTTARAPPGHARGNLVGSALDPAELRTSRVSGQARSPPSRSSRVGPPRAAANVVRSGGFENLALSPDGTTLFTRCWRKPLDASRELVAFSFDLSRREFTGVAFASRSTRARWPSVTSPMVVSDLGPGPGAGRHGRQTRRVQAIDRLWTFPRGAGGVASRHQVADLMKLETRGRRRLTFPFWTPEGVTTMPDRRIAIVADNNYPFGRARHPDSGVPDETELILLGESK